MNQRLTPRTTRNPRRGFTLIEMLLVIVIIGILAALILPAVQGARLTAQNTAVRAEISALEAGIANFKAQYGIEPPSRIALCENAADWNSNAPSRELIRRMWPNYDFSLGSDFNNNGTAGESGVVVTLNGSECLVFFLGGIVSNGAPQGFSKNPASPFTGASTGEVRVGPFFEFVPSRVKITGAFGQYFDSLPGQTSPYVYLSSYEGKGYQPADIPPVASTSNRVLPSAYRVANNGVFHKAKSFQIISPGSDGAYTSRTTAAADPNATDYFFDPAQTYSGLGTDKGSYDNITNLAAGKLVP